MTDHPIRGPSLTAVALVAIAVTAFGCANPSSGGLSVLLGDSSGLSMSVDDVPAGQPLSFGSLMLCVSTSGSAALKGVSLHEPTGNARVDAFAVRPNPFASGHDGLGADRQPLTAVGGGFLPGDPQVVSGACPAASASDGNQQASQLSELGVQVSWDGQGEYAGSKAVDVQYQKDGHGSTLTVPFAVWLCAAACPASIPK